VTNIQAELAAAFSKAIAAAFGPEAADADPQVKWAADARHGDLQANFAMGLGKRLGKAPREVADAVVAKLALGDLASKLEVAGPGFVNVTLAPAALARLVAELSADGRIGAARAARSERVVIDYSAPNVAKEMHVGHIRSTIIGDALARVLGFQGHEVLRRNHLGDWGTQFGMLVEHVRELGWKPGQKREIGDLNALYREAKARFDAESDFAERSRLRVVALQGGDEETVALWRELVEESKHHFAEVYETLGVLLDSGDYYGESFYNPMLGDVAAELERSGVATVSDGALCLFLPAFKGKDGSPVPLIVRKGDGGYGYDTTDLAAIRHRIRDLKADRLVYVTGAPQKQHFAMIFEGARVAGWLAEGVRAEHVPFGSILGDDGKPFRTRAGESVRLQDLLAEALERAYAIVAAKSPDFSEDEKRAVARAVGIGAVKYADLSNDRIKDYVFDWDRMLAFEGNTAPYLQNAYVRIMSIFRKAGVEHASVLGQAPSVDAPEEHALARHLLAFGDVVEQVARSLEPHRLCTWLYELAASFHHFYEKCPVMTAPDETVKRGRLALCAAVAEGLERGLSLLGIATVKRM